MYRPLVPCPACHRHVRASDERCPFCAAPLPADLADRAVPGAKQRLSRAAAFVFGATVAVAGCGGEVIDGRAAGGSDEGASGTGGNGTASGTGAGGAPEDDGGTAVLYGPAPPPDGGPDDDGGNGAKYGAPPMPDGGQTNDGGGGEPIYGAPPPPE